MLNDVQSRGTRRGVVFRRATAAAAMALAAGAASAQPLPASCGQLANGFGPFDYRVDVDKRGIVESFHFTTEVELLIRGKSGRLGGDLDYTLRAFPNHHRALVSMMRYAEKVKVDPVPDAGYTVQCYFARAVAFRPDDTTARMLYATYLNGQQRRDDALAQLALAKSYAADNAFTHYNLGMVYMDIGEPRLALEQAHVALSMGFHLQELKRRLVAANQWREPAPVPAAAASAAAPAAAR